MWLWAKPRETSPAKPEPPVISPRGREAGPAETGNRGGAKDPEPVAVFSAAARVLDQVAISSAAAKAPAPVGPANIGSAKGKRTLRAPAQEGPSTRDLTQGSRADPEMAAADAEVGGE